MSSREMVCLCDNGGGGWANAERHSGVIEDHLRGGIGIGNDQSDERMIFVLEEIVRSSKGKINMHQS